MPYILEGGGNNGCPPQMNKNGGGTSASNTGSNPALLTSTGGLFGNQSLLLVPYMNTLSGRFFVGYYDHTDFNCEEDATYIFRQEDGIVGRDITISQVVLVYRNLGVVKVQFKLTTFLKLDQTYVTALSPINKIGTTKADKKLYTIKLDLQLVGERPEFSITRLANKGPLSIISVTLCGTLKEGEQQ